MTVSLIMIGTLLVVGIVLRLFHKPEASETVNRENESMPDTENECCGLHEICEKVNNSILSAECYFDDEELDRYHGRAADDYTEKEIEEFREIMVTLLPREIPLWGSALEKRGVTLPAELKDEFLILLSENT